MSILLLSVDERLTKYDLILNVAENDTDIKPIITNYGYDSPVIQEGRGLYTTAYGLQQNQKKEYGEQYGATDVFGQAKKDTFKKYMELAGLARIVFKRDRNILSQLDLVGERERSFDKQVMQMKRFYDNALGSDEIINSLGRFNITAETLNAGKSLVEDLQAKYQAQLKESSEAQRATRDRDAAIDELDDWMSDFLAVAKILLALEPEYLERFGIVDPS